MHLVHKIHRFIKLKNSTCLNICAEIFGRYLNLFVGQRKFVSGLMSDIEIGEGFLGHKSNLKI